MAKVKVAEFIPGRKLKRLDNLLKDRRKVLAALGTVIARDARNAFKMQGIGPFKWKARSVPSVAGIVDDMTRSSTPRSRRFEPRPALLNTGRLQKSIAHRVIGKEAVIIGTNVGYGKTHQQGGISSIKVTDKAKKNLKKFLNTGRGKKLRDKLGFLFGKSILRVKVPKRTFLLVTKKTVRAAEALVIKSVNKSTGGAGGSSGGDPR